MDQKFGIHFNESIKSLSISNLKKKLLQQCLINISSLYILYNHFFAILIICFVVYQPANQS